MLSKIAQVTGVINVPTPGVGGGTPSPSFTDFKSVVIFFVGILNQVIVVLVGIAVLVFIYGVVRYIGAGDDTEKTKLGKKFIIYGIIGIAIIMSVWGIVLLFTNTFQLNNTRLPQPTPIFNQIPGG